MAAANPYFESFAFLSTSFSDSNGVTWHTGPKTSFLIKSDFSPNPVNIVGSIQEPESLLSSNIGIPFEECKELEKKLPNLNKITGNQIMPGFTSPKIEWVRKYEKENFSAIQKILLPKDYLRLKWSGEFATDTSDASGTMWLNTKKRSWSNGMCSYIP